MLLLKNHIFSSDQKKKLNGKDINGEILAALLLNYISAINDGAVPNIESAWTFICME